MKIYIHTSSALDSDWYMRKDPNTGQDCYMLSVPSGNAKVFRDLNRNLYYAKVRLRNGRNCSSVGMKGLIPCMNWAEGFLFT